MNIFATIFFSLLVGAIAGGSLLLVMLIKKAGLKSRIIVFSIGTFIGLVIVWLIRKQTFDPPFIQYFFTISMFVLAAAVLVGWFGKRDKKD